MNLHKSQSGFTALHILLLLVIVGIIGFAGWKVYSTGKNTNTTNSNPASSPNKQEQPETATSTDPYDGWETYTSTSKNFTLRYPKDWKLDNTGTGVTITSQTGVKIGYAPLTSGVTDWDATEVSSCGTQAACGVDVIYSIDNLNIPDKDNVSLVKIGTDTPIHEGIYLQPAGEYRMELHTPTSAKSTPVLGPNKLGQGKDGYMIYYKIKAQNKDWISLGADFPNSYKSKTPQQAFSTDDAKAAEKILKSLAFKKV